MATYQTQSKVSIIGTIPTQFFGGTVSATIIGTVPVTQPFLGTVGLVGTIATILSPIVALTTPVKRATISFQQITTVPTTPATILVANPNRAHFYVRVLDVGTVLLGFAGTVSLATFTAILFDYEVIIEDTYTGVVTAQAIGVPTRVVVSEV